MKTLERIFGPPMAAPETAAMRRLRFAFIGLALICGAGILGIGRLVEIAGAVGTGAILLTLMSASVMIGGVFFIVKHRRDDRWILGRGFDTDGGAS